MPPYTHTHTHTCGQRIRTHSNMNTLGTHAHVHIHTQVRGYTDIRYTHTHTRLCTVCTRVHIHYKNTHKCTHQSTNRNCRGTHKSAHPGHLQSPVYTPSSVYPHRPAEEFTRTVSPAAPVLAKCGGKEQRERGTNTPRLGIQSAATFRLTPPVSR